MIRSNKRFHNRLERHRQGHRSAPSAEPSQCILQDRLQPTEVQRRVPWRQLHGGGANLQEQIIHYNGLAEVFLVWSSLVGLCRCVCFVLVEIQSVLYVGI